MKILLAAFTSSGGDKQAGGMAAESLQQQEHKWAEVSTVQIPRERVPILHWNAK